MSQELLYTVAFENQTIAAASGDYDIFEFRPATTNASPLTLVGFDIDPTTVTGDADEEQWRMEWLSMVGGTFTSGTGGATPTPVSCDLTPNAVPTAGFGADTMNPTVATTTGTTRVHHAFAFNARIGTGPVWLPEGARIQVPGIANCALILRLMAAIATDESFSGTAWLQEGA